MRILAALFILSTFAIAQDRDSDRDRAPQHERAAASTCVTTTFFGNVHRGLPYVQPIGGGLSFRLVPFPMASAEKGGPNFIGWTIEVAYLKKKGEMEREFSWVMTPPYRQWNARQLNTSYGKSVSDVFAADHTVYFPLDVLDYAEADRMVTRILWRSSPQELVEAQREIPRIPIGATKLTILGQQLGENSTSMETLSFKVDLTIPTTVKLTPALADKTKPAPCPVSPLVPMLNKMIE